MPVCISTRLRDVLALDYPRLIAIVGNSEFHNLVTDCLVAAPPNHASVRNAGLRLPGFLTEHPRSRLRLWLADLALLERTRLEVFDAADSPQLELSTLRALAPGDFAELPLRLIAARAFLSIDHAASDAWLGTEVPIDDKDSATAPRLPFVVWRERKDGEAWTAGLRKDGEAWTAGPTTAAHSMITCGLAVSVRPSVHGRRTPARVAAFAKLLPGE